MSSGKPMAETSPDPNNKAVVFEGKTDVERSRKIDALRKSGRISDKVAARKGLAKGPADSETMSALQGSGL